MKKIDAIPSQNTDYGDLESQDDDTITQFKQEKIDEGQQAMKDLDDILKQGQRKKTEALETMVQYQ